MRMLRFVMIWGLVLPWIHQLAVAQEKELGRWKDGVKEAPKPIDAKPAKKKRVHPVRWDFEALEARFKITRFVMGERDVVLICQARVEGIVKESDFRYSRFDKDKKTVATQRSVRFVKADVPSDEPGARAATIRVKAGEEFRVILDWAPYGEDVRYVVVGSDENPRESGPPSAAPPGFERPELILDGSEHGPLYPAFADIDGDGKIDMVVGTWNGRLLVYRNKATSALPVYAKPTWLDETVSSANIAGVQG